MRYVVFTFLLFGALLFGRASAEETTPACPGRFAVQVLGSGGPIADDARASASYLVWIDGRARLLVDAGGGAFVRYAQAGASFTDHSAILVTHFHADHSADLDAILNSGSFQARKAPLPIIGPASGDGFPGVADWLKATFDDETGAYRYLSGFLTGSDGLPRLDAVEVDTTHEQTRVVLDQPDLRVTAIPVVHGDLPALGYLVQSGDAQVVFTGDQSVLSYFFEETLTGVKPDLLIAHFAINGAPGQPRGLHRSPAEIGALATTLQAKRLVLAHVMQRAIDPTAHGLADVEKPITAPSTSPRTYPVIQYGNNRQYTQDNPSSLSAAKQPPAFNPTPGAT